mgnify:CR=1 FL=1
MEPETHNKTRPTLPEITLETSFHNAERIAPPEPLPAQKTGFDKKSYQREYMRKYRKTHRYVLK